MAITVKLADVAKAAGVSQGTVSNVFNRPDLVSEELRSRVEEVARSLGYRGPDPRGRMLRAGRVGAIGVVTADRLAAFFTDPYSRRFMAGIADGCSAVGAGLALVSGADGERAAWNIRTALVDGFIVNCFEEGSNLVELALNRGLPFVATDFTPNRTCDVVRIDDQAGAALAAGHLLDLGHRRFAILALEYDFDDRTGVVDEARIAGARYAVSRNRTLGYRGALAAAGIDPASVPIYEHFNDEATIAAGVDAILARQPDTTAFLCMSDVAALAAIRRLAHHGLDVPGRVSVIGFDDTDEAGPTGLTTIRQPIEEKGRVAARLILDAPDGPFGGRDVVLPIELVVRATTAPPPV